MDACAVQFYFQSCISPLSLCSTRVVGGFSRHKDLQKVDVTFTQTFKRVSKTQSETFVLYIKVTQLVSVKKHFKIMFTVLVSLLHDTQTLVTALCTCVRVPALTLPLNVTLNLNPNSEMTKMTDSCTVILFLLRMSFLIFLSKEKEKNTHHTTDKKNRRSDVCLLV